MFRDISEEAHIPPPERKLDLHDVVPAERFFMGSTETMDTAMLTADALSAPIDFVNHVRARSAVEPDPQTGQYIFPVQVVPTALANAEATAGIFRAGLTVHAQLPPLDTHGRASGEWELVLLTRKGEKHVVTDPSLYTQFLTPHTLGESTAHYFSLLPPREGRPFPRLAVRQPVRRARG